MVKVLIIEDDPIIGEMLEMYLSGEGYEVKRAMHASQGRDFVKQFAPEIILLDLMLPDSEGPGFCQELRESSGIPIIVISMRTQVADRIHALTAGADDYLCKPFSMQELKARMMSVLRRTAITVLANSSAEQPSREVGLRLDTERRAILMDGEAVETTFSEYEIMKLFYRNPEKVFTREELISAVRGIDSFVNDRAIDVHITNLRKKIEANPREPRHIKTVWGVGYKFIR